jgi:hypothetical protein
MDQRIEAFLADVLALAGEDPGRGPGGGAGRPRQVRGDLPAAGAEELQRRRGTRIGEHLKLVLSIIATPWSRSAPSDDSGRLGTRGHRFKLPLLVVALAARRDRRQYNR